MTEFKLSATQEKLLEQNIIEITDEIGSDSFFYVREAILRLIGKGSPDITLIVSSGGGSVSPGLSIYDALRFYQGKKTGIVVGFARSMAVVILQACETRKSYQHAGILIHHISQRSVSLDTLRVPKRTKQLKDGLEEDQKRIYTILGLKTSKSIDEIRKACEKEIEMTPEQAKEFGLIDEII